MKQEPYNNFRQRIHKSARSKNFPLRVMFELTYRCNFFCGHCYVPLTYRKKSPKEELKITEVFSILDQLKDLGCFYLGFTGGEPFVRKDIMDILWYAKRSGFEIIIHTNGSLINKDIAEELARLSPNKVDITIPAMSEGAFDRISGVSGSKKRVFEAIKILHKKDVNLGFKTCVLKDNESEIKKIQNFAYSKGALHRLDSMLSPRLDGSKQPYNYRGQTKDFLGISGLNSKETTRDNFKGCNLTYSKEPLNQENTENSIDLFTCGVGRSQVAISPAGELKMCLMIDYPKYKILDTSLREAWLELRDLVSSIKPDNNYHCNSCGLRVYCEWCPGRAWLKDKNFTTCEPESRRFAERRRLYVRVKQGRLRNNLQKADTCVR